MIKIRIPSIEELILIKEYINYNSINGKLTWKKRTVNNVPLGQELKTIDSDGYYKATLNKKQYKAHRVAWFLYYGEWPKDQIDHINGIRNDNRIKNLRLVTDSENKQNRIEHRNGNSIGIQKIGNKWRARAPFNFLNRKSKKQEHIGCFDTKEEAAQAIIDFCLKINKHG